jgi:hypothetical protein
MTHVIGIYRGSVSLDENFAGEMHQNNARRDPSAPIICGHNRLIRFSSA